MGRDSPRGIEGQVLAVGCIHYVSLYYFIVILSVSGSGESSHNGLSEGSDAV